MGSKTAIALIIAAFAALIALNPGEERLQTVFMNHAHTHFFELSAEYRQIYEELRSDTNIRQKSDRLRYGNFLLFSTLSYDITKSSRKILAVGAMGFAFPVTL